MYPGALLAQEACSYQAMTELLRGTRGRLVVLIHSDRDCSNVLPKVGGAVRADLEYKFLCTNLKEDEMVTGQGNAKLRRAIELVWASYRPDLVVVLSTCPTVMIGDNIKNVASKAAADLQANVVAEITHGLRPKSPAEIVDLGYTLLTRGAAPAAIPDETRARRVNLVGFDLYSDERREFEGALAELGIGVNTALDNGASLDAFLRVAGAGFNVHPGPNMMIGFDAQCRERFGIEPIEVPLPFGVGATDRFYRAIAAAVGVAAARVDEVLGRRRAAAAAATGAFREGVMAPLRARRGRAPRCAYNVGSVRSFELRRIALEELGELPFFEELGFEATLFIQGPQDEANQRRTAAVLAALGVPNPFVVFPDPGGLARFLEPGAYDLFYGTDFLRDQLTRVSLPLLHHRTLKMGYDHVAFGLDEITHTLRSQGFYRHFRAPGPAPAQRRSLPVAPKG